jgi:putative copper export protein
MLIGGLDQVGIADPWSVLMLIKHAVVILMIVLGARMLGAAAKAGAEEGTPADVQAASRSARLSSFVSMICGIVVLLLTAVAEAL